jgi:undecaprenyl-diphosphatase
LTQRAPREKSAAFMSVSPAQGLVYGVVQGLTEFLPVSSSAHLVLLPWLLGWPDPGLAFDVALHLGTLLAVLWYFWRDWLALLRGAFSSFREARLAGNDEARLFWKARRGVVEIGVRESLLIGLAQAAAIAPGVSRSGATITAARLCEIDRESSARFSFFLAAPIIAGASLLKASAIIALARDPAALLACVASAASGFLAIGALLRYVRLRSYAVFALYRGALAALVLGVTLLR